jgi:hypothetical protein
MMPDSDLIIDLYERNAGHYLADRRSAVCFLFFDNTPHPVPH